MTDSGGTTSTLQRGRNLVSRTHLFHECNFKEGTHGFCTLNFHGLNSRKKQYRLPSIVSKEDSDVLGIEETKMMHDAEI